MEDVLAKRVLDLASQYCRWPDGAQIRLTGLDAGLDACVAVLLGGFVFDVTSIYVRCGCGQCARLPANREDNVPENETCIKTLVEFAVHASISALQRLEDQLYDSGLPDDEVEAALCRLLADVLFVLDVPYDAGGGAAGGGDTATPVSGRPEAHQGPSGPHGQAGKGTLPLSAFLRQASEAAGGEGLVGRPVWVHAFTAVTPPAAGGGGGGASGSAALGDVGGGGGMHATSDGAPHNLFRGRLVRYEEETGAFHIAYDPGQPLEGWKVEGCDHSRLHPVACHVRLEASPAPLGAEPPTTSTSPSTALGPEDIDLQAGMRRLQLAEGGLAAGGGGTRTDGLAVTAVPCSRLALRGPFHGCLEDVPRNWEDYAQSLLHRATSAHRAAATAAAAALTAGPVSGDGATTGAATTTGPNTAMATLAEGEMTEGGAPGLGLGSGAVAEPHPLGAAVEPGFGDQVMMEAEDVATQAAAPSASAAITTAAGLTATPDALAVGGAALGGDDATATMAGLPDAAEAMEALGGDSLTSKEKEEAENEEEEEEALGQMLCQRLLSLRRAHRTVPGITLEQRARQLHVTALGESREEGDGSSFGGCASDDEGTLPDWNGDGGGDGGDDNPGGCGGGRGDAGEVSALPGANGNYAPAGDGAADATAGGAAGAGAEAAAGGGQGRVVTGPEPQGPAGAPPPRPASSHQQQEHQARQGAEVGADRTQPRINPFTGHVLQAGQCYSPGDRSLADQLREPHFNLKNRQVEAVVDERWSTTRHVSIYLVKWVGYELDMGVPYGRPGHWVDEDTLRQEGPQALKEWRERHSDPHYSALGPGA